MVNIPWRGIAAVAGGFLIHFTLGTLYTFGNMSPYIVSYMRKRSASQWMRYSDATWIFSITIFGQGAAMAAGGVIERYIGTRLTALLGVWVMSLGVLLSFLTVKANLLLVVLTYGLLFGIGTGISYAVAIAAAMAWFPKNRGLVGGIVVAGFGGGSFVFDQLQTLFINPANFKANSTHGREKYFDQAEVLDRVPYCFLLLGSVYAAIQLVGVALMRQPDAHELEEEADYKQQKYINRHIRYTLLRQELVDSGTASSTAAAAGVEADEARKKEEAGEEDSDCESAEAGGTEPQVDAMSMLRRPQFWVLWATFLVNSQAIVYLNTQYKSFGLSEQLDDHFMAIVGSLAAVCNALARVAWGHLHDGLRYRPLMFVLCCAMTVLLGTFVLSSHKAFYLIWVCAMFATFAGNFALFPAACARLFGHQFLSINYGLLFTANATSAILGAVISALLKNSLGWLGLFLLGAGFSAIGAVLTLVFPVERRV